MLLDRNGDGVFKREHEGPECFPIRDWIWHGDRLYRIVVAPDASTARAVPLDVPMGTVHVTASDLEVVFRSAKWGRFYLPAGDTEIRVPEGEFTLEHYICRRSCEGSLWKMYNFEDSRDFRVRAGQTTVLQLGEPIRISIRVERTGPAFTFHPALAGMGESGTGMGIGLSRTRPGKGTESRRTRPIRPRLLVIGPKGDIVHEASLDFRGWLPRPYTFYPRELDLPPGVYTVTFDLDWIPFQVVIEKAEIRIE